MKDTNIGVFVAIVAVILMFLFVWFIWGIIAGEFHYKKGVTFYNDGNYDMAISSFNKVIEKGFSGCGSKSYFGCGVVYARQGKYKEAIDNYSKAIEIFSIDGSFYNYRAIAYYEIGDVDKARHDFYTMRDKKLLIDPKLEDLLFVGSGDEK